MVTQFAILIGDNAPDYADDGTLFVYVVIYVFVCTLALLNFLLAIVVAGYDSVREKALENQVATSFAADAWGVPVDGGRWLRHGRWPSKVRILNTLFRLYPVEFSDPESQVFMGESEFVSMVQEASRGKASPRDALLLFAHYQRYPFLLAKSH
uniref:Ion transport domain-containing protein n=1 Tax=Tetraselmis chuii TaxID=63592 RepID=A0A7S1SXQ1_9CHLO|mmetsp:Transcript_3475/g.6331  ORF Transcript_3475/g.6331 Transcript_3475/m.6331 type:complete len:153 (+) Transcript_3475:1-459(+)